MAVGALIVRRIVLPILIGALASESALRAAQEGGRHRYAGQTLIAALEDLRSRGLRLIYSDDLVRPDLLVETEPPAGPPRDTLDRLIAPFGLRGRDGPGGTVLIVRSEAAVRPVGRGEEPVPQRFRDGITVRPDPPGPGGDRPEPRQILDRRQIERRAQLGDDLGRAIVLAPGFAAGDRSTAFSIRGGAPDETQYILDGLAIDDPTHLKNLLGYSSIIDTRAIDTVELMSGGFPVEFGGRLSGVVELASAGLAEAPRSSFGVSTLNAGLLSEGPLGETGGWLLSSRAWYPDALLDIVDPGGEGIHPISYDLLAKAQTRLAGGTTLSAHLLAARDEVGFTNDSRDTSAVVRNSNGNFWLNVDTPWSARLRSQSVLSSGQSQRSRQGGIGGRSGGKAQVSDDRSFAFRGFTQDWVYLGAGRALLKWGFGARRLGADYDYTSHAEQIDPLFTGGLPVRLDRSIAARPSGTDYGGYVAGRL
ncbi:MAG TPA: TonB-dependent receptor plug domain-containing protein, partial [Candidatus Polarisedimenticolia bacterium]|nr:TonB-dependent receptor plug domain-containing protein [Candidatus Polarisedimenticolia bacterium]